MKVKVCPECKKYNLENSCNCVNCGTTLSVKSLIDINDDDARIESQQATADITSDNVQNTEKSNRPLAKVSKSPHSRRRPRRRPRRRKRLRKRSNKYLWLIAAIITVLVCSSAFPKVIQRGMTRQQTCIRFYSSDPLDNICTETGGFGVKSVYIIRPIWWYNTVKNDPLGFIERVDHLGEPVTERAAYEFLIFECLIIYLTSTFLLGFILPEQRETENKKIDA